jgi:membrane-associated protease RseP (regulator of RpoE activity)
MLVVSLMGGSILTTRLLGFLPLPLTASLPLGGGFAGTLVTMLLWVNIFWGLITLMPVQPLDGGNVARNLFIQYDPWDGARTSFWLSAGTGAFLAVLGLIAFRSLYMALLFGILAYQSYQVARARY